MQDLTFTQEYLLCALNPKGSLPLLNSNRVITCLVASGLLELLYAHAVSIGEKKKIIVQRKLTENELHLTPLYNTVNNAKPMTIKDIAGKYVFATSKRIHEFMQALAMPMRESGIITAETSGLFGGKVLLIPDEKEVAKIIEKIRADFLEDGAISDETIVLGALLEKSGLIKSYFSQYESRRLKERLEEVRSSEAGSLVKEMVGYIDAMVAAIIAASTAGI